MEVQYFDDLARGLDDGTVSRRRARWRKIWSTNPIERINKEIERRSRVVGIFPNNAAAIRLVGAILLDMQDEWVAAERRYLSEGSMAKLYTTGDNGLVAALDSGA
jgi:putative transposase